MPGTGVKAMLDPHPSWLAVLILAARYGSAGLFAGLVVAAGAVGIASPVTGTDAASTWSRLQSGSNLVALAACLAVSWVSSWHLRARADLSERLHALSHGTAEAQATIEALCDVATTLRARVDRRSASLSFLRDVATRLEGADPVAAAEAAADLALARTGALAAEVRAGTSGRPRRLAARDVRGPGARAAPHADPDLTVPIRGRSGLVGDLALWGVRGATLDEATAHDLDVITSWSSRAIAMAAWMPQESVGAGRAL
jgi:uncharacterized coiled-coil protein SlyX